MPDRIRVACVQMTSRSDKAANIETAERLVAQAAATGADVVVLPEKWNAIGDAAVSHATAEAIEGGESVEAMSRWSRQHGITLVGGSITERRDRSIPLPLSGTSPAPRGNPTARPAGR